MLVTKEVIMTKEEIEYILKAYVKDSYAVPNGAKYLVVAESEGEYEGLKIMKETSLPDIITIKTVFEDKPPIEMDVDYTTSRKL